MTYCCIGAWNLEEVLVEDVGERREEDVLGGFVGRLDGTLADDAASDL